MSDVALWTPPRLAQPRRHDAFWNAVVSFMGTTLPLQNKTTAEVTLAEAPQPDRFGLLLRFESGLTYLAFPVSFPFATVVGADLAIEDLPLMPEPLRDAMLDGMVALSTLVLPETDQGRLALVASGSRAALQSPPEAELRWFRASLGGFSPAPAVFDVGVTIEALSTIFGDALSPRRVWPSLKQRLQQDGVVTVGRITLPLDRAREIRTGSVIVLDRPLDPTFLQIRVGATRFSLEARDAPPGGTPQGGQPQGGQPQGGAWTCTDVADLDQELKAATMSLAPPSSGAPATDPRAGDLAIAIDFDIGRVSVPLSDLETWQKGSLVALSAATAREGIEVTLRANGQPIGRGDLVQIDDRLAVRVTEMTLKA